MPTVETSATSYHSPAGDLITVPPSAFPHNDPDWEVYRARTDVEFLARADVYKELFEPSPGVLCTHHLGCPNGGPVHGGRFQAVDLWSIQERRRVLDVWQAKH